MGRPRNSLSDYVPALSNDIAAVNLENDMGAQIVTASFVAGTAAGLTITLNSLRTSNVIGYFYPAGGESYRVSFYEATSPTQSAYVWGLQAIGASNAQLNQNIYGKLTLLQRA